MNIPMFRHARVLLTISIFAMLTSQVLATESAGVSAAETTHCEGLLGLFTKLNEMHQRLPGGTDLVKNLAKNETFQSFLKETGKTWNAEGPATERAQVLDAYSLWAMRQLTPERIEKLRSESLVRALQAHGVHLRGGVDGRQALEDLSAANLKQFLATRPYERVPEMAEAEALVTRHFELDFIHNSNFEVQKASAEPFVLSSGQLSRLGFGGGLNSMSTFNREIVRSDDNVFFDVFVADPALKANPRPSEFGSLRFGIDRAYARKNGWISAYVMVPEELMSIVGRRNPSFYDSVPNFVTRSQGGRNRLSEEYAYVLMDGCMYLKDYDFTVKDFEALSRDALLGALNRLRVADQAAFDQVITRLRAGNASDLGVMWLKEMSARGLPSRFEFKVPVLVDKEALKKLN